MYRQPDKFDDEEELIEKYLTRLLKIRQPQSDFKPLPMQVRIF